MTRTGRELHAVLLSGEPAEVIELLRENYAPQSPHELRHALTNAFTRIGALEAELVALKSAADLDVAEVAELLSWLHEFTPESAVGKDFVWRVVQLLRYFDSRLPPLAL